MRALDYGMRTYFCAVKEEHPEQRKILSQAPHDKESIYVIDNFVRKLRVHLHIYDQDEGVMMKQSDQTTRRPLILIFRDNNNRYYSAYHPEHLRFNQDPSAFPSEKLEEFPFSYQEREPTVVENSSPAKPEVDLHRKVLQELARRIVGEGFGRDNELLTLVSDVMRSDPDLNQDYLQRLYNKLNESINR